MALDATPEDTHSKSRAFLARAARFAHRHGRALAVPLVVALPPMAWVLDATHRASLTTLGRDQGIFQYVAWAIRHGAVDYRDVRDVNGPLTHIVHMILLALGGADEHRFRSLDLLISGLVFALVGACLPGIARRARVPLVERAAWGLASWVVMSGQLLLYLYWDLAQRETFFDWFVLASVGLQLVAQRSLRGEVTRALSPLASVRAAPLLAVAGALTFVTWFGKPTFAIFSVVQALAILFDNELSLRRRDALAAFFLGGLVGWASQILFLLVCGDIRAFLHIYLVDVPAMYRFMLPRSAVEILSLEWGGTTAGFAFATSALLLGLVYDRQLPRRALAVALFPVAGMVSVLAQGKGFPYHFHPVTAGLHVQWLLLVVWLWEKYRFAPRARIFPRLLPLCGAAALALKITAVMPSSPHIQDLWILAKADDAEARASHDYLVYFRDRDFFPWEMRETASYLRAHTKPDDRVQTYGMDPYVLFLAERMSATPYIYVYDLNADAALGGSWIPTGLRPNQAQAAVIRSMRDAHEADMLRELEKEPPAAFVFFDKAPLTSFATAWEDFTEHCPKASPWVLAHYRETAAFGEDHVWLRNDVADAQGAAALVPAAPKEEEEAPAATP